MGKTTKLFSALSDALDMSLDARMKRAYEQGFDHVRATAKDIPDGDFGYSFYADANSGDLLNDMEKVGFYGKNRWVSRSDDAVPVEDLIDDIAASIEKNGIDEKYGFPAMDLAIEAAPDDIINSGGLWDNDEIVPHIWSDVLEPRGIVAVKTPDGMVRFDNNGRVRSVDATFDPAKRDSANLLAGLGGAAVLGAALAPDDAQASQAAPPELIAIQQAATKFSQANTPKRDFWRQRRQQLNELINAGDDFVRPAMPYINSALESLDLPMKGYYGLSAALGEMASGQGLDASLHHGASVARQPIEQTAYDIGWAATNATGSPAVGSALNAILQMMGPI